MAIALLDDKLISQIAAGEVVERPASIVKELVENSLDAHATAIDIKIEQGGLRRIVISDNGSGVAKNDLPLALARHATSKIDSLSALEAVTSLGFRGEALASIASVADLRLTSKASGQEQAFEVSSKNPTQPKPAARPQGTSVEVRELFAQVPARRKFLKKPATEFKHIRKCAERMALSRPDVAFSLVHDGREIWRLPACNSGEADRARIAKICGQSFDDHALVIDETANQMRLTGWVATPGFSRSQADLQYSYVNGRFIRDKVFNHAVKLAYRDVLHNQRFPAYVLYLSMPGRQVDVNAHPTKAEVRFRESGMVHEFVFRTLAKKLAATAQSQGQAQQVELSHSHESQTHRQTHTTIALPARQPEATPTTATKPAPSFHTGYQTGLGLKPSRSESRAGFEFQKPDAQDLQVKEPAPAAEHAEVPAMGYAIGQLHNIYILAQNATGLVLVDMHAAHERILYEQLKAQYSAGEIVSKALLIPQTLVMSEQEADLAMAWEQTLESVGFEISRASPTQLQLRGVPAMLAGKDCGLLLQDVLAEFDEGRAGEQRVRHAIDDLLADVGCKAAIKAGHPLTRAQMNQLLRDMEGTRHAGHCNHGRPSWVQVDMAGLDKMFMRGQ